MINPINVQQVDKHHDLLNIIITCKRVFILDFEQNTYILETNCIIVLSRMGDAPCLCLSKHSLSYTG